STNERSSSGARAIVLVREPRTLDQLPGDCLESCGASQALDPRRQVRDTRPAREGTGPGEGCGSVDECRVEDAREDRSIDPGGGAEQLVESLGVGLGEEAPVQNVACLPA